MIETIYVEREIAAHPRTQSIRSRFPNALEIPIERYGEVFNRNAQSFRLQKRKPSLILAKKFERHLLSAPEGYGIGTRRNYYFSHVLNCLYDCRYCFLQGMFRSAHYVVFVNYESFQEAIRERLDAHPGEEVTFFSGYDGDSLALESITGFIEAFVPFFADEPLAWLELRTKSAAIRSLLRSHPLPNCVIAFSFTPEPHAGQLEHHVPPIETRLDAMSRLAERGFRLGLRFDPLIFDPNYRKSYQSLFETVFRKVPLESLHSVTLGPFRLPREYFQRMERLYPEEKLFAVPLEERSGLDGQSPMISYPRELEEELVGTVTRELSQYVPAEILFPCPLPGKPE